MVIFRLLQIRLGLKSHLEYDKNDNLTKVTDALGGVTTYGYDNMDNLVTFTNAANKITNYTYDLEGNLTSIKDPAGRTEKFDYDEKGRLTGHTQASGKKTTYDYDKLNDLLEKSYQDAKGETSEKDVTYAYNSAGERVSMKDQTGKSSYEYDALGRITKVTSGSKKDVSYVYDDADNLQAIVYPDGTRVSYEYDLNDNLVKLTDRNGKVTTYKHDALNRVTEVVRSNGTKTEVSYDAEDHITKIVNTCGSCGKVISTYEYKYNDQGYVVSETATELEAGTRKTPSWEDWYNWGDTQKETDKADCEHQEKEIQTTRTYEYDDNWELTRCTEKAEGGKKTVHNYTYDKIGNRTSYEKIEDGVSKAKFNYKYNDSNQLIKRTNAKIWGDPGTTYSYDKDGNLIQECDKTNSADPVTYEYTAENRLAVVKQGGTVLMAAMYDGDNNRVFELDNTYKWEDCYGDEVLIPANQRTEDGNSPKEQLASLVKGGSNAKGYTLTEYINDINRENTEVLAEYGADEKVRQAYTYGESGIGERVSVDKSEESSYYLYDGRNSVTGILTETANLTNSYQYDPYGNLTSGTADGVNYYGYNGESTNVKTGLQYLRARYYNAENGTFTTEDSDLGTTENPLTRNRYAYTSNNPVNYDDPTGHSWWKKAASAVKRVGKKIANTAKKVVKNVVNTVKNVAKTVVNTVKKAVGWVQNTAKNPKKAIQKAKNAVQNKYRQAQNKLNNTYNKIVSKGSQLIRYAKQKYAEKKQQFTDFVSYVSQRTKEIRANVSRELCSVTERAFDKKIVSNENGKLQVTSPLKNAMDAFKEATKEGELDYTIDLAIGAEKDKDGNYHIKQNYWQSNKFVGYNDLYDDVFKAAGVVNGSVPDIYKKEFMMNGETYIIWAWKGDYINLGAGAETGIYKKGIGNHYFTATGLSQKMQLSLKDTKNNNTIFDYNPTERQWWVNGFNPNHQGVQAKELESITVIQFSDSKEDQDLFKALAKTMEGKKEWNIDEEKKTATLTW